jgi:type IV secretion system protein VirB2
MILRFKNLFFAFLLVFSFSCVLNNLALADASPVGDDGTSGLTQVLCHVIGIAQGSTGKTIAILVVISMAMGLFLGKITWGVAIAVAVGMGVLFGANTMVGFISSTGTATAAPSDPCKTYNNG